MRDVLTEGEIYRLASMKPADVRTMLQAAARLGAERERERALRSLPNVSAVNANPDAFAQGWRAGVSDCAVAIRRGEDG